jgi:hypothetical protein
MAGLNAGTRLGLLPHQAGHRPTRQRPPNTLGQRESLTSILCRAPSHPAG